MPWDRFYSWCFDKGDYYLQTMTATLCLGESTLHLLIMLYDLIWVILLAKICKCHDIEVLDNLQTMTTTLCLGEPTVHLLIMLYDLIWVILLAKISSVTISKYVFCIILNIVSKIYFKTICCEHLENWSKNPKASRDYKYGTVAISKVRLYRLQFQRGILTNFRFQKGSYPK